MIKLLVILIFYISLNLQASNFIEENFNDKNMSLSDTYRYIVNKNNINEFIKNNSMNRKNNNKIQKYLNKDFSLLCHDLYYGNEFLIKNKRESLICLKYALQTGYTKAAVYLSEIHINNNNLPKGLLWGGIAEGLGQNIKDRDIYVKYLKKNNDFVKIFNKGVEYSTAIDFKLFNNSNILIDYSFDFFTYDFNQKIIMNSEKDNYTYEQLLNGQYVKFVTEQSYKTDNAQELILLSHIKNNDWNSLIQYCDSYIPDYFYTFCLKTLYKNKKIDKTLFSYALNNIEKFKTEKNKLRKKVYLKRAFNVLGYGLQDENKFIISIINGLINQTPEKYKNNAITYLNEGRIFYFIKKDLNQ
jgi:hypothetical protein